MCERWCVGARPDHRRPGPPVISDKKSGQRAIAFAGDCA
jgi:hypothetical protein